MKKLLFLGSDHISEVVLKKLISSFPKYELSILTSSQEHKPAVLGKKLGLNVMLGSKGPIKEWNLLQPGSELLSTNYDYLVVASFGHLIPKSLLEVCDSKLNMHPSLLPRHRGASPIPYTIYNRDSTTGVSIIDIHEKVFDKGRILKQVQLERTDLLNETFETLSYKLAHLGAETLVEVIDNYKLYYENSKEQEESLATKAPKITTQFAKLDFRSSEETLAKFRALKGTSYNSHFNFRHKKILPKQMRRPSQEELEVLNQKYPSAVEGSIWVIYPSLTKKKKTSKFLGKVDNFFFVKTGDSWVCVESIQLDSKPHSGTEIKEFLGSHMNQGIYYEKSILKRTTGEDFKFH